MATLAGLQDLKAIRKALDKSQSELAVLLGLSTRAVQSYEQGWRPLPPYVQKLAAMLLFLKLRKGHGKLKPCWKLMGCEDDCRQRCFAFQHDAGDFCWATSGDACTRVRDIAPDQKMNECSRCPAMTRWLDG